jgi:hypothetical protein
MFYTIFYQDSMIVYLEVAYEYKSILVIIFDGRQTDRWRRHHQEKSTVERAPLGEDLGGEGAVRRNRGKATTARRDRGQG